MVMLWDIVVRAVLKLKRDVITDAYTFNPLETDTDTNTDTDRKRHASWVMGHASCVIGTALRLGRAFMMHTIYQERGSMHILVKP